jgi:hypothetical protein
MGFHPTTGEELLPITKEVVMNGNNKGTSVFRLLLRSVVAASSSTLPPAVHSSGIGRALTENTSSLIATVSIPAMAKP